MDITNFTESIVFECLDNLLKNYEVCKCDRCRADMAAIALNNLPPRYYVSFMGETFTRLNSWRRQVEADVIREVVKAIAVVSRNPHHGK